MERNEVYKDLDFPNAPTSIGSDSNFLKRVPVKSWQRIAQFCKRKNVPPFLFKGGIEPADIKQQTVGDCYFMGALVWCIVVCIY